jgi:co-chaperonin GroES (HSP10)
MNCLHNKIKVQFEDNTIIKIGNVDLVMAKEWASRDKYGDVKLDDNGNTKFEENVNYLESKPQICTVIAANNKYPYKVGDRLFCHYMSFETASNGNIADLTGYIIADYVILTFNEDGTYKMADGIYLGKQELTKEEITPSGIYLSGGKAKICEVRLKHLPNETPFEQEQIILTIDNYNYPCVIDGEKYIMLREHEIVGTLVDER